VPLSVDNIIQVNTGSFNATGGNATLPNPVTAGSTVVIVAACPAIAADSNVMVTSDDTAFEAIGGVTAVTVQDAMPTIFAKRNVAAGGTSWGLTPKKSGVASARQVAWVAMEVTGVGLDPLGTGNLSWYADKASSDTSVASDATSISTYRDGVTSPGSCYDTLGLAVFAARGNDATVPVWSGYTNGWTELANVGRTDAGIGFSLAVAYKPSLAIGYIETTATCTPLADLAADAVSLYADGARHAHLVQMMSGAEFGSMTGAATMTGHQIFDTATANVTCVTNIKRTGNYAFKYASTSAACNTTWSGKLYDMTSRALPFRLNVYFETALPGIDVELASIDVASVKVGTVTYRTASQKIEMKVGTGTAVLSDAVVVADQWIGIDGRYDPRCLANAQHICDWQVDYNANLADTTGPVVQTQAVGAGTTAGTITTFRMGWTQSITATVYMDDLAVSRAWGAYPLGDLRIRPLKVDPAGTPTVHGDATLFKTFTANGTMATWTAAATVTNLAEVPPTIGSTASGLAQVTVGLSGGSLDWVNIPMETYDAAGNGEAIRAVGHYVAGWAAATTAAGIALSGNDGRSGVDGATGWTVADANWDSSTQVWAHWMHHAGVDPAQFYPIPQANLDAMQIVFGQSPDATPDIGIHCVLSEVATQPLATWPVSEVEGGAFTLYGRYDPVDSKLPVLIATTPSGTRGATVTWAIRQVDQTPQYVGPGQVQTFLTGAETVEDVTSVGFSPDAPPEV
jgi:hypothetical protein